MNKLTKIARLAGSMLRTLGVDPRMGRMLAPALRGKGYADGYREDRSQTPSPAPAEPNPLLEYFMAHEKGHGIFKYLHYFDIYHRHFSKFVGKEVRVMEIGVYSGGSLGMWRTYFGPKCTVYGVDIEPACLSYADDGIHILIGDQGDRNFWRSVRDNVPPIDILIDDGSHHPPHQIVTLEEMLPHIKAGGVYLCEDVYGYPDGLIPYVFGLFNSLGGRNDANDFMKYVDSLHLYPYVAILEKCAQYGRHRSPPSAVRRGTEWAPIDSYAKKGVDNR